MKGIRSFDDAIEEAKRTMRRFSYYVKVVITRNSDGKTKTVYGNEDKMRYFVISLEEDPENALRGAYDRDVCIRGVRKPSTEEAEVFTELDRKQIGGHELHVANVEEVPRAEVMQSFDIDNVDASSVFGLDEAQLTARCHHCVDGDCEFSCEYSPCTGSLAEQDECAYC